MIVKTEKDILNKRVLEFIKVVDDIANKNYESIRKSSNFRQSNLAWNKCNSPFEVGRMSELVENYLPNSTLEFALKYFNDAGTGASKGKSFEEFVNNSLKFKALCLSLSNVDITIEEALVFVYCRLFLQTFLGYSREKRALQFLQNKYPERIFKLTKGVIDSDYGVDIIEVDNQGEMLQAYQVKPKSFRKALDRAKPYKWAINMLKKNKIAFDKCQNDFGIRPKFFIFD